MKQAKIRAFYSVICVNVVAALTGDCNRWPNQAMPPTALFMLSSHGHAAALAGSPPGPLATMLEVSGFVFVLLAAALIVTAMERARSD